MSVGIAHYSVVNVFAGYVVEACAVRRKPQAIGEHDAAGKRAHAAVETDDVQMVQLWRITGEHAERQ
jgi:hypothetical protein